LRRLVDRTLEQRRGLGPTCAAVRTRRRGVGGGHRDVELDGGEPVGAVAHAPGAGRQVRTHAGVGTGVAHQSHAQAGEPAVAGAAELDVLDLRAAVRQGEHVLAARGHPGDGSAESVGQRGHHLLLGVHARLAAETAADVGRDDAQLVGLQSERAAQQPVQHVWHLGAAVDDQPAVVGHVRRRAVRLHRGDGHALVDVAAAHDHIGVVEDAGQHRVGGGHRHVVAVFVEDHRRVGAERVLGTHHRVERFVVDDHRVGSVLGLHGGLGHHGDDRLADEAHLVGGQRWTGEVVVHLGHAVHRLQRQVGRRVHADHTRHADRLAGVDVDDAGVRHLGAHEHHVQRTFERSSRRRQIVDVADRTEQQLGVLRSQHTCPQDRSSHAGNLPPDVVEGVHEVGDQVGGGLDAHAETHERVGHLQR
jgi:hypothetical protein